LKFLSLKRPRTDYLEMRPIRWLCAGSLAGLLFLASFPALGGEIILRPSDTIQLKISGVPANDMKAVTGEYMIDGQGYVNMPNLGRIKIAGLSISAAQTAIETGYRSRDIYTRPAISISMGTQHRWVNVDGEVKKPQRVAYKPDLTVLASINAAGGFSSSADEHKVRLLRADEVMVIDIKKIRADPSLDIPVEPGDRIEVPKDELPLVNGRS
jgi:protein involved in polysaccharide export with SLBB domain